MTSPKKSWRDILPVHPAADEFPMMSEAELRELGEDIRANGLRNPIAYTCKNVGGRWEYALVDGRNRLSAMELVGVEFKLLLKSGHCYFETKILPYECLDYYPDPIKIDGDPHAYIISANIHRRHLTAEARQDLLIKVIARAPAKSDRQIAKQVGVNHKTVARARAKGEDVGRIPHVGTRTDSKGREQPAHKTIEKPREQQGSQALVRSTLGIDESGRLSLPDYLEPPERGRKASSTKPKAKTVSDTRVESKIEAKRDEHRIAASTAPRNTRVPGSPEWCYQTINLLKFSYRNVHIDHEHFEHYLNELREHHAWEKIPVDNSYGSEERMLAEELGKLSDTERQAFAASLRTMLDLIERNHPLAAIDINDTDSNGIPKFLSAVGNA